MEYSFEGNPLTPTSARLLLNRIAIKIGFANMPAMHWQMNLDVQAAWEGCGLMVVTERAIDIQRPDKLGGIPITIDVWHPLGQMELVDGSGNVVVAVTDIAVPAGYAEFLPAKS